MTDMNDDILDDANLFRFARQLILPGFTEDHQIKLAQTRVLLIGAGGLGVPVLQYLIAAGIGAITLIDHDAIDLTNLNRQVIYNDNQIGMAKVKAAATFAKTQDRNTVISAHKTYFEDDNADQFCQNIDLIIDASDNPATRYAANRAAHRLKIPLVFGGAVQLDGQVSSFTSGIDKNAPCYECVFPESPGHDLAPGCQEAGIIGAITGIVGSAMALEVIKQLLQPETFLGPSLNGKLMLFDGRYMSTQIINLEKSSDCKCCSASPNI